MPKNTRKKRGGVSYTRKVLGNNNNINNNINNKKVILQKFEN